MPQGKVKWFNNAKGYGFIIEDGGSEDLFAHFSSIQMEGYKTLKAGQTVQFEKQPSGKGVHAVNIVPTDLPQSSTNQPAAGASVEAVHSAQNDAQMETPATPQGETQESAASAETSGIAPKAAAAI